MLSSVTGRRGSPEDVASPQTLSFVPVTVQAIALQEFTAICDEVDAISAMQALTISLSSGAMSGIVGHVDVNDMSVSALTNAVTEWEPYLRKASVIAKLVTVAKTVLDVRKAIIAGDWDFVSSLADYDGDAMLASGACWLQLLAGVRCGRAVDVRV